MQGIRIQGRNGSIKDEKFSFARYKLSFLLPFPLFGQTPKTYEATGRITYEHNAADNR
jgi:hypothetical protein